MTTIRQILFGHTSMRPMQLSKVITVWHPHQSTAHVIKVKCYPGLLNPLTWLPNVWLHPAYLGKDGTLAVLMNGGLARGTAPIQAVLDDPENFHFDSEAEGWNFLQDRAARRQREQAEWRSLTRR